jgi:hypothetical protein
MQNYSGLKSYQRGEVKRMKKCQKCNFQNEALIDYCWQCGSQLPNWQPAEANYNYQNAQPTQAFQTETPTYFRPNQTLAFNTYQNNFAPRSARPVARSSNYGKVFLILGSIFVFFLMFSVVGAATAYKVFYAPKPNPVPPQTFPVKESEPVKEAETVKIKETEPTKVKESKPTKTNSTHKTEPVGSTSPSAKFDRLWVDYNVREKGRLGMRVHVKFSVYNMKNVDSYLAIYFEKEDGTRLRTKNKKFASKDGQVAIYRLLKPAYDDTVYDDLELFMPYDELKLGRGKYNLKMDADVIYENGEMVEHLDYYNFEYEKF